MSLYAQLARMKSWMIFPSHYLVYHVFFSPCWNLIGFLNGKSSINSCRGPSCVWSCEISSCRTCSALSKLLLESVILQIKRSDIVRWFGFSRTIRSWKYDETTKSHLSWSEDGKNQLYIILVFYLKFCLLGKTLPQFIESTIHEGFTIGRPLLKDLLITKEGSIVRWLKIIIINNHANPFSHTGDLLFCYLVVCYIWCEWQVVGKNSSQNYPRV